MVYLSTNDPRLAVAYERILAELVEIRALVSKPKPEWETLTTAATTRRKSRETLLAACAAGVLTSRREPTHGGKLAWLLKREDLDKHFPIRE